VSESPANSASALFVPPRQLSYGDEWRFVDRTVARGVPYAGVNPHFHSAARPASAALEAVGICLIPGLMVRDDLDEGRLVRLCAGTSADRATR